MEVLTEMKKVEPDVTNPLAGTLPQKLKMCREKSGLSMRDVAKKINKTAATICKWESGQTIPYGETLLQLCELYKVDITTFFGINTDSNVRITPQEIELINLYRNSTNEAQSVVRSVLKNCQIKK